MGSRADASYSSRIRIYLEAADQLLSVFTLGLTKYVFALIGYLGVRVDPSCAPAVEAPLG